MSANAGSSSDLISVPKGGGALKGLGEKFSPDLHTGTGNYSIPISVPPGRNGFQPSLTLGYSTGSGNGPFGLGWSLSIPGVSRLTSKGIPSYRDDPLAADANIFVLSGAEDLVPVEIADGLVRYSPRTEGLFARITHHRSANTNHWEVSSKDGLVSYYGTPNRRRVDPVVIADPAAQDQTNIFAWRLTSTEDPFGNRIEYEYEPDQAVDGFDQLYLKRIRYADYGEGANRQFLVSVTFEYHDRTDAFSEYRSGFEIRTRKRCKSIVVRSHPNANQELLVRAYEFIYVDEIAPATELPLNGVSLLKQVNVIGYDKAGNAHLEMPPLEFGYSRFSPQSRRFIALEGRGLPATSLTNPDLELVDLFGHGLPDILELGGTVRYWRNLGNGRFDMPRPFSEAPASWRLSDSGVQILDANGDGRADLLVTTAEIAGYYPLDFRGRFSRKSFQRYRQAPSFNLEDPEVRLVDLTGDGVSDVLRAGTSFECFFNHPKDGWLPGNTRRVSRQRLDAFPDVNFSDPRVKFADLSGDGLQDIALVHEGRIDYWPNLGHGQWGRRITMAIPERLPRDFDPQGVLLGDVDGDGLADMIYVSDREITLWINRSGNGWSTPITIRGTPTVNTMVSVRLTDLLGNGVGGILWTRDGDGSGRPQHFFLDLTGGSKPYLLDRMVNNLGAVTQVSYASSTKFYLQDQGRADTRWRSTLPFPVQVVDRVVATDAISQGALTTEYRYHHGYWDGVEREFRGFGMVEQLDTEVFDSYAGRSLQGSGDFLNRLLQQQTYAPPLLTRTWFHQGPVDPADDGHWAEYDCSPEYWPGDPTLLAHTEKVNKFIRTLPPDIQRDALRTLRGSVLRTELYALDGSPLQDRPYTVTEQAYDLRQEDTPAENSTRRRIFFPHGIAQRTTQWERGNDPLTQFSFTADYDDVGQPQRQIAIACPRGWRRLADAPAAGFLATLSHTKYVSSLPDGIYIRDRVARARSFEIKDTEGKTVEQLATTKETDAPLRLIAESLNFYDSTSDAATDFGAFTGLPLGQIGRYGAPVRAETLVMTGTHLDAAYGTVKPPYLAPGATFQPGAEYPQGFVDKLPRLAGYIYRTASAGNSEGYFTVAASKRYDFHRSAGTGRGLVLAQRDPLGHETSIQYDAYQLLPTLVTGPTGFTIKAQYDYRVLQPKRVTDPNDNTTELEYSPTGLVTKTWVRGKPNAPPNYPRNAGDRNLPSIEMEYHLRAFYDSEQPVFVRAIRRVHHDSDPDDTGETIEAREYSDGFGRLLQTRTQGESVRFGNQHFGSGNAVLPAVITGAENTDSQAPNVVVSGWQRYDNKGRVIEKYEPFYDVGWAFQPKQEEKQGQHVSMFYDPRGQVIRTVNPDGSEQRVIHGIPLNLADPPLSPLDTDKFKPTPWEAYTYDANDNAGRTHAGIKPHSCYSHHYNTPASIEVDALGRTIRAVARHREAPPANDPTALPPVEEHVTRSTYDIQGNLLGIRDALGRLAFEYIYDLAKHPLRTESIDAGRKLVVLDSAGNAIENRDAKGVLGLHAYDVLNRPTHLWARDAAGEPVTLREQLLYDRNPVESENTTKLNNLLGQLWRHHDEAGVVTVAAYDFKGQVLSSSRQVLSDEFMLGNFNGHVDGSDWNLQAPRVDWANPPANLLDARIYETRSAYDTLGRVKWSEYPEAANETGRIERYRLRPDYNRAGGLEKIVLQGPLAADGTGASQPYVQRIAYNAKGQRSLIVYGNGLITRYAYDPATFRLARLRTDRLDPNPPGSLGYQPQGAPLQDITYGYDLAGNILSMLDRTPGCGVANNPEAIFNDSSLRDLLSKGDALLRCFDYDPLYRLVSATGREGKSIPSPRPWSDDARDGCNSGKHGTPDQDNAPKLTTLYWEEYAYDAAGNMLTLRHNRSVQQGGTVGWNVAWSRRFGMHGKTPEQWRYDSAAHLSGDWINPPSNRLTHVQDRASGVPTPATVSQSHSYDANGNMEREHAERHFEWDYADRMKVFRNQVDASRPTIYAFYLYDAGGQRVKKLVVTGNRYRTTTSLGSSFEHHTEQNLDGTQKTENCSLHVMDDKNRIAIKRVGSAFAGDGAADHPVQYHLGDHLGSSGLVVSDAGEWINREEFFPYGETSFGSFGRKRYRFTGQEKDEESGLSYHSARYFSTSLCLWMSADPIGHADSLNLYVYCRDNPIVLRDLSGQYGEAGHYYTVKVIALAAGFSPKIADRMANLAQAPDEIAELDAVAAGVSATVLDNNAGVKMQRGETISPLDLVKAGQAMEHAVNVEAGLHALTGANTEEERAWRRDILASSVPGSLEHGLALHAFGDSFTHSYTPSIGWTDDPGPTLPPALPQQQYVPPLGHGPHGTAPDAIDFRPKIYGRYVKELFDILSTQAPKATQRLDPAKLDALIASVTSKKTEEEQIGVLRDFSKSALGTDLGSFQPEQHEKESSRKLTNVPDDIRTVDPKQAENIGKGWKNNRVPVAPAR